MCTMKIYNLNIYFYNLNIYFYNKNKNIYVCQLKENPKSFFLL